MKITVECSHCFSCRMHFAKYPTQEAVAATAATIPQSRGDLRGRSPKLPIRQDSKELSPVNGASLFQPWWKENN